MHIIIDRDAVCAADDMSHHREEFTVPDGITIASLFEFLEFKYIPVIAGNNVVWALHHHDIEVGTYFTQNRSFIMAMFHYHLLSVILKETTNSICDITVPQTDTGNILFNAILIS